MSFVLSAIVVDGVVSDGRRDGDDATVAAVAGDCLRMGCDAVSAGSGHYLRVQRHDAEQHLLGEDV